MPDTPHSYRFLHAVDEAGHHLVLDHRLNPMVRAMLLAMVSRTPVGGLSARYDQVVTAVADSMWPHEQGQHSSSHLYQAEERLCALNTHPVAAEFADRVIGNYGHSSPAELTGSPSIYADGISWFTAWVLFDNPLQSGQENSTRAIARRNWPVAREADGHGGLIELDRVWSARFEAELDAWKEAFTDPDVRAEYDVADKEPFRPALDRARWALSGAKATGVGFSSHIRERERSLRTLYTLVKRSERAGANMGARSVVDGLYGSLHTALPKLGQIRAPLPEWDRLPGQLPLHLKMLESDPGGYAALRLSLEPTRDYSDAYGLQLDARRQGRYLDPWLNQAVRVHMSIPCSLAVARDWHRHRTAYPWQMLVLKQGGKLSIAPDYSPRVDEPIDELLDYTTDMYEAFLADGDVVRAMMCLPLGTRVQMCTSMGLRDAVYMLELRAWQPGANFEYRHHARRLLKMLAEHLKTGRLKTIAPAVNPRVEG